MSDEVGNQHELAGLADLDPLTLIMSVIGHPSVEDRLDAACWAVDLYLEALQDTGKQASLAPLMAALLSFLKDDEPRVRGAIAVGLLPSDKAPRAIMLQLLSDIPVISAAVAQNSKVLVECDLMGIAQGDNVGLQVALAQREELTSSLVWALIKHGDAATAGALLSRDTIELDTEMLAHLCNKFAGHAQIEALLLTRAELSGVQRLNMCLANLDRYYGAQEGQEPKDDRIARQWRAARDDLSAQLVDQAGEDAQWDMIKSLAARGALTPRLMARALMSGYFGFLEVNLVYLAKLPPRRVAELFISAPQATLAAVYKKCGTSTPFSQMMAFATVKAREIDLEYDARGRFMLVNACITWLETHHADETFQSVYQFLCDLSVDFACEAVEEVGQASQASLRIGALEPYDVAA